MVLGGAVVLAVALGALALAAAALLREERRAGRDVLRLRTEAAAADFIATLDRTDTPPGEPWFHADAELNPAPRLAQRAFDRLPAPADREVAFLLRESGDAPTTALARAAAAAAATAAGPMDEASRLRAAATLAELAIRDGRAPDVHRATNLPWNADARPGAATTFPVPTDAEHGIAIVEGYDVATASPFVTGSREYAWLCLHAGPSHRPSGETSMMRALGTADDARAAAILVATADDPAAMTSKIRFERACRAAERDWPPLLRATPVRRIGNAEYRLRLEHDGAALIAGPRGVRRLPAAAVAEAARTTLDPLGISLTRSVVALPDAVEVPVASGWVARRAPEPDEASRARILLAGIGVAAGAALVAFLMFVRAVRRESRAASARADFVATVSHELRTPVAVVRTAAETLLSGRAPREEDRARLLDAVMRESVRLSGLVGNVLDFTRIDAGTRRYTVSETEIDALVGETVRRSQAVLQPAGLLVDVEIPAPLPRVACDADALGAALANLLDNAAKFRGGSDRATVRATATAAPEGGHVTIDVIDHGVGVPDAEKPHVFDRFFRGADPRVRETRGAGIGLALVRHAAEAHGGGVEVLDTPGGGATFRLTLPVAPARERGHGDGS